MASCNLLHHLQILQATFNVDKTRPTTSIKSTFSCFWSFAAAPSGEIAACVKWTHGVPVCVLCSLPSCLICSTSCLPVRDHEMVGEKHLLALSSRPGQCSWGGERWCFRVKGRWRGMSPWSIYILDFFHVIPASCILCPQEHQSVGVSSSVSKDKPAVSSVGFVHAFVASLSVIIVSELGDKTFFIAAIMAMRHARSTVLSGAIAALGLMTVMSTTLGYAVTIIPRVYTYYGSSLLFALFGLKMLRDGYKMSADEGQEELEEVTAELKRKEAEVCHVFQWTLPFFFFFFW